MRKLIVILLFGIFSELLGVTSSVGTGMWMTNFYAKNTCNEKTIVNELSNYIIPNQSAPELITKTLFPYYIPWQIDVSSHSNRALGCTVVHDSLLWVSCGSLLGDLTEANYIFIFNLKTHLLIDSFVQATPAADWGYYDLCFDGTYIYGSAGTTIDMINPNPPSYNVVGSISPSTGLSIHRALACDNYDSLFTSHYVYQSVPPQPIWKFHNTSLNPHSYTNTRALVGLAYDPNGLLWGSTQDGANRNTVAKYKYPAVSLLEEMTMPQLGIAGGCEFYKDTFLLYVDQTSDKIAAIQLYFSSQYDMMTQSINMPSITTPFQRYLINATVMNLGSNTASAGVTVKMRIFGPDGAVYYEDLNQVTTTDLTVGQSEQITFIPQWQVPDTFGIYTIKIWTELPFDENPSNDTMTTTIQVTNWLSYADWNRFYWYTWGGPERTTWFVPSEFGVLHPITIDSLKAQFYLGDRPWTDSTFKFKIYAGDGTTVLYESDTIRVTPVNATTPTLIVYALDSPITINSGNFYIAIAPRIDSMPSSCGDNLADGRSFYGTAGAWGNWTNGEYFIGAFVEWEAKNDDVGPEAIVLPTSAVSPNVAITPKARFKNYGFNDQFDIPVGCVILSNGTPVYSGVSIINLNSGDTGTVFFYPQWTPGPSGTVYDIKIYTSLGIDENNANDTLTGFTSSFTITNNIYSNYTENPPTIDGNIQTAEWTGAEMTDVSDILGRSGIASRAGSAYLWLKHDSNFVYFAGAMPYATTANNGDQLGLYLDEDNDGTWANDFSEGNYWLINYETGGIDSLIYRAITPTTTVRYGPVPSSQIASTLTNGYIEFEGSIPIGITNQDITVNPNGDTMGFWMYADDEPGSRYYGWWSQNTSPANWSNPSAYGNLIFRGPISDVGITNILAPTGSVYNGFQIRPKAIVRNYGLTTSVFPVIFNICEAKTDEYCDTQYISLNEYQIDTLEFNPWFANVISPPITFNAESQTLMMGDENTSNDAHSAQFEVIEAPPSGWAFKEPITTDVANTIKDGGAMVGVGNSLYAFVGTKTKIFKQYSINDKAGWTTKDSIQFGLKPIVPLDSTKKNKKYPGKGAALCSDGFSTIFAVKGNGLKEFWIYNIATDKWTQDSFVSVPKGLKGGTSMIYYDGKVYLLAGSQKKNENNFFIYDVATKTWTTGGALEMGINQKVWKDGSSITLCNNTIYALKGGDKFNPFYAYNFGTSTWEAKEELPIEDTTFGKYKKKLLVKDGGAMASDGNVIYAIKGGATDVFWKYIPGTPGQWQKLESIPCETKKKTPKTGAAMAYANDKVWLLKGNKTPEFLCYGINAENAKMHTLVEQGFSPACSEANLKVCPTLNVSPNPSNKLTTIRYNIPNAGKATIKLYNSTGKLISTLLDEYRNAGSYSLKIVNCKLKISSGVYFIRFETNTNTIETKLIIR